MTMVLGIGCVIDTCSKAAGVGGEEDFSEVLASSLDPGCAAMVCSREEEEDGRFGVVWVLVDLGCAANVCSGSSNSIGESDGSEGSMAVSLHHGCATGVRSGVVCSERMNSGGEYDRSEILWALAMSLDPGRATREGDRREALWIPARSLDLGCTADVCWERPGSGEEDLSKFVWVLVVSSEDMVGVIVGFR